MAELFNELFFSTTTDSHQNARATCQAMNLDPLITDLVSISDQAENDFIDSQAYACIDLLLLVLLILIII